MGKILNVEKLKKFNSFKHEIEIYQGRPQWWIPHVNETNYPVILYEEPINLAVLVSSVKPQPETHSYIFTTSDGEYDVESYMLVSNRFKLYYYDDNVSYSEIEDCLQEKSETKIININKNLTVKDLIDYLKMFPSTAKVEFWHDFNLENFRLNTIEFEGGDVAINLIRN